MMNGCKRRNTGGAARRGNGSGESVVASNLLETRIRTGVAAGGSYHQPVQIMVPAFAMRSHLIGRKAAVSEAHNRAAVLGREIDFDQGGTRRDLLAPLPTKSV